MLLRLFLLFTIIPLVELGLLIEVGKRLGLGPTVAIVITTGALGAWLARAEGLRTLHAIRAEMAAGRMPTDKLVDGLLILVAGAVLLTPGLLTDAAGFFLLVPAGRAALRRAVSAWMARHVQLRPGTVMDASWTRED